jgi:hypothetical protein
LLVFFAFKPDAPIELAKDELISDDKQIKITWKTGLSNGGSPISNYTVYYDEGVGDFIELITGVKGLEYTTTEPLSPGLTYNFKVSAKNSIGESLFSSIFPVLAATFPDTP